MVDAKVVASGTAAVAVTGLAVAGAHSPEGFWPVTVVGWLTMATSVGTLVTLLYLLYKKSLSPVVGSVTELRQHFDEKIAELEEKYDDEFSRQRSDVKRQIDNFTLAVHERLNGFGGRLEQNEADYEVINRQMAQSQEDRRHINEQLGELRQGNQRIIELLLQRRQQ